jgi:hypothetical protein
LYRIAYFVLLFLLLSTLALAQKRGSEEMGGGVSFWSVTENDSAKSDINVHALWARYIARDFMIEIEPYISARFEPYRVDLTGLLMGGVSKRIMDVSNVDRSSSSAWQRKHEQTTAGIYGSASGGIWAERSKDFHDKRIYAGPALSVGLGTHSSLGSLTKIRTKFQLVYLMPAPPLHEDPRTMFYVTVGFGVITKL